MFEEKGRKEHKESAGENDGKEFMRVSPGTMPGGRSSAKLVSEERA
jgi:hypothetical protein